MADRYNGRVQVYSPTGTFLRQWGGRGLADGRFNGALRLAERVVQPLG